MPVEAVPANKIKRRSQRLRRGTGWPYGCGIDPEALATARPGASNSQYSPLSFIIFMQDASKIELSVVMPCLNEAETLETCILKAQKAFNVELARSRETLTREEFDLEEVEQAPRVRRAKREVEKFERLVEGIKQSADGHLWQFSAEVLK